MNKYIKKVFFILVILVISCNKKKETFNQENYKFFLVNNDEGLFLDDSCITANEDDFFKVYNLTTNTKEKYFLLHTGLHAGSLGYMFYILKECPKNKYCKVAETQGHFDSIAIENKKTVIYYNRISGLNWHHYLISFKNNKWNTEELIGINDIPMEIIKELGLYDEKSDYTVKDKVFSLVDSIATHSGTQIHYIKNRYIQDSLVATFKGNRTNGYKRID